MTHTPSMIPLENIEKRIYFIRGHKVMLSTDLARLYGVRPMVLIQAVKRNADRFPDDFMFQLSWDEFAILKSQIVISRWGGLRRAAPYAFTEQGVAMLSSVLRSQRAVQVNIAIIRTFIKLRLMAASHRELGKKLAELERWLVKHDMDIESLFNVIDKLKSHPEIPLVALPRRAGFKK